MGWVNLEQDIAAEFEQHYVERIEIRMFAKYRKGLARWAAFGADYRKTKAGRLSSRTSAARTYKKNRAKVLGECLCACGRKFNVDADRIRKKRVGYCSAGCPAVRKKRAKVVNGLTLSEWAANLGIPYSTLWARVKRGASLPQSSV
jgi:hypothetical protein